MTLILTVTQIGLHNDSSGAILSVVFNSTTEELPMYRICNSHSIPTGRSVDAYLYQCQHHYDRDVLDILDSCLTISNIFCFA